MKRIGLFVVSYVVALLLLGGLLVAIEKAEGSPVVQEQTMSGSTVTFSENAEGQDTLETTNATLECMSNGLEMDIKRDISCLNLKKQANKPQIQGDGQTETTSPGNEADKSSWFVVMIYALIALTFALMVDATAFGGKYSDGIGTWAIQLPPMFGVAGTMYALAMFASASSSEGVLQLFRSNVADAVGTTLYGIFIYALNLALASLRKE